MTKYEFLEKLRKDLRYSRKKIAEHLNVSASAIEKYEKDKLDFNYKTKYILGICALAGYNNEIFINEEIDDYMIEDEKLTLFSTKIRQILYFLNIEYDEYTFFLRNLITKKIKLNELSKDNFLWEYDKSLINYKLNSSYPIIEKEYYFKQLEESFKDFPKEERKKIIKKTINEHKNELYFTYLFQIITIYSLNFFNPKEFYTQKEFAHINYIVSNEKNFLESFDILDEENIRDFFDNQTFSILEKDFKEDLIKLKKLFPIIKQTIEELEKNGKSVNKETIKEFKIELESGTLFTNCNTPTDPKDKQICELLQYAPTAFKDKIIEKLLQYKKDVEEF